MGSLMSGWDCPVQDPKVVRYRRNKSLTKEEINAYWRSKKKNEEEHLLAISKTLSDDRQKKEALLDLEKEESLENVISEKALWTRSSWAYLNEPPVTEDRQSNTYTSRFHVAKVSKFPSNSGISAN